MNRPAIAGLILSAGASRRMGFPKALLEFQGETFLDRWIAAMRAVCSPVVAVLGHDAQRIQAGLARASEARFVLNPDPERGMLSSLQCGLASLDEKISAVIFTPVDYPAVRSSTVVRLAEAFHLNPHPVTVPVFAGQTGHPVCVSREAMERLRALPDSAQARDVIHAYRGATQFVEAGDPGVLTDVDLPEEYRMLRIGAPVEVP